MDGDKIWIEDRRKERSYVGRKGCGKDRSEILEGDRKGMEGDGRRRERDHMWEGEGVGRQEVIAGEREGIKEEEK